jgi:hypothetical protein
VSDFDELADIGTKHIGTANGRGANGLFAKGNKLGTGNPLAKKHAEFKKALLDCATAEDIRDVFDMLLSAAKGGDIQAAKLLLEHLVGRPSQAIELTGGDGGNGQLQITLTHVASKHDSGDRYRDTSLSPEPRALPG